MGLMCGMNSSDRAIWGQMILFFSMAAGVSEPARTMTALTVQYSGTTRMTRRTRKSSGAMSRRDVTSTMTKPLITKNMSTPASLKKRGSVAGQLKLALFTPV